MAETEVKNWAVGEVLIQSAELALMPHDLLSSELTMAETKRLFVALPIPKAVRSALQEAKEFLTPHKEHLKMVNVDDAHLTIKFLGDTSIDLLEPIQDALGNLCKGSNAFELRLGAIGCFPEQGKPKVIWYGVEHHDGLTGLQGETERVLTELGFIAQERSFAPHITLARVRRQTKLRSLRASLESFRPQSLSFQVKELCLYESVLAHQGPKYSVLQSFKV